MNVHEHQVKQLSQISKVNSCIIKLDIGTNTFRATTFFQNVVNQLSYEMINKREP